MNSYFYNIAWPYIKHDIIVAVQHFFDTLNMPNHVNCTSITLVPKVQNACEVKSFRPIYCCNVLHKIISKMLTSRMQNVIPKIVSGAQSGFIPSRQILDNVLLVSELIKGYGWKNVTPRFMVKIDLRKAYESVEWSFIQTMMNGLGFPHVFVSWFMKCITFVSYSILVNGNPTRP